MKLVFFAAALVLSAQANATWMTGRLSCKSPNKAYNPMTLKADSLILSDDGLRMVAATMTVADESKVETGRAQEVYADKDYNPRKYKNHSRFDIGLQLINTETFGHFYPLDECSLSLMIPNNAFEQQNFKAPVVMNCDQSGQTEVMDCELSEIKNDE